MLDPLGKAKPIEVPDLSIPVELNDYLDHGTVLLVAQGERVERIIARHLATVEAFIDGGPGLKVIVFDPRIGAPPLSMTGGQ